MSQSRRKSIRFLPEEAQLLRAISVPSNHQICFNIVDMSVTGFSALLRQDDFSKIEGSVQIIEDSQPAKVAILKWSRRLDPIVVYAGFEYEA